MAIRGRFLLAAVCFWRILAPGAPGPVDAEPLLLLLDDPGVLEATAFPPSAGDPVHPGAFGQQWGHEVGSDEPTTKTEPAAVSAPESFPEPDLPRITTAEPVKLPEVTPIKMTYGPEEDHHVVRQFVDRFTGSRRDVVGRWLSRSTAYLEMIRDVLRTKGLPEDLAFTAMIESGFNPVAVSRAGAKGLWQFMAATARRYGLRVDSWVDERLDPEKSTVAAASYLNDLYNQFGSWALAHAAYNAGEMTVIRAIRGTGSRDFWTLAQSRYLRQETKEFVPQIHAATVIGRAPERFGFEVPEGALPPVETVRVPGATDLRRLATASRIPVETLRSLNAVLVRGVTPPGGPYDLRVPIGTAESVAAALTPRRSVATARVERTGSRGSRRAEVHVVRPRETVTSIARQYGVSISDVVRWNGLARSDRIHPGDRLRVADHRPSVERDGQGGFR
jgi:membrane-bound lytic murein transglycosylase D